MLAVENRGVLLAGAALGIVFASTAAAQTPPGDQSGTPRSAGEGQSAAASTQAPADAYVAPVPTQARAPRAAEVNTLGEVIVTARRVEERLQDVPISITVFNQQQLENRNVVQGQDLAIYTPSLSTNNNYGSANITFAIRGFVQDQGTQPSVGVYFADVVEPRAASNGIPAGDGAGPGDFFDLQNVQVLKGPQGTLFGRNTTGGAILLVPQKPTGKTEGFLEVSGGDYDLLRVQGVFNTPINDRLRVRVGFDHESRDGYVTDDNTGNQYDDINYYALRASAVWDILPNLENYAIASYTYSDTNGPAQRLEGALGDAGLPAGATAYNLLGQVAAGQIARENAKGSGFYTVSIAPTFNPDVNLQTYRFINTTAWRATDNLTLKNIASYASFKEDLTSPLFSTAFDLSDAAPFPVGTNVPFATDDVLPGAHSAHQSTITEELQAQGSGLNARLQYQGGVYLEESLPLGGGLNGSQSPFLLNCSSLATLVCSNPAGFGSVNVVAARTAFHNLGLYTQATYAITDKLKLTGGFRYTWDHVRTYSVIESHEFPAGLAQSSSNSAFCNDFDLTYPNCGQVFTERSSAPTGTVDLDYKPVRNLLIYIKYSRGYRAGGISPQAPGQYATFQPERVNTYEAGLKSSIRVPVRGTFNLTGFYNNLSSQQLNSQLEPNVAGLGPAAAIINAGQSRIYGLELESSLNLFDGFTLDLSYAYLNTELTSLTGVGTTPSAAYSVFFAAQVGNPLVLSPQDKATVTGTYILPINRDLGRISIAATFTHVDRQLSNYSDDPPNTILGAYSVPTPENIRSLSYLQAENLLNLNLNWNGIMRSHVDVQGFVTNLTDQHYFSYTPGFYPGTQFELAQLGEPRMFGFRIRYHFGQ